MDDLTALRESLPPTSAEPSLLSLPPEIKLHIVKIACEEALWRPNTPFRCDENLKCSCINTLRGLLLSCKELSQMAQALVWSSVGFNDSTPKRVADFATTVVPHHLNHIKGLSIRDAGFWDPETTLCDWRLRCSFPSSSDSTCQSPAPPATTLSACWSRFGKQIQELQVLVLDPPSGDSLSHFLSLCPLVRHLKVEFHFEGDHPARSPSSPSSAFLATTLGSLAELQTLALTGEPYDVLHALAEEATWAPKLTHLELSSGCWDDCDAENLPIDSLLKFLQHVAPTLTSFYSIRPLRPSTDLRPPSARFSTLFLPRIKVLHLGLCAESSYETLRDFIVRHQATLRSFQASVSEDFGCAEKRHLELRCRNRVYGWLRS